MGQLDQLGQLSREWMIDFIYSLILDDDARDRIIADVDGCGKLGRDGWVDLINSVTYKEPPSQDASRLGFTNLLDGCGRFVYNEMFDFVTAATFVNESINAPTDEEFHLAIVDNGDGSMTLKYDTDDTTLHSSPRVVCIGSSTMAGYLASAGFTLFDRINAWFGSNTTTPFVTNLAVAGYYSDKLMPTGSNPSVDIAKNITKALSLNPDIIICSLPSNDVPINSNQQFLNNLRIIKQAAIDQGVVFIMIGMQPRTSYSAAQQQQAYEMNLLMKTEFGRWFVDVMDLTRDVTASTLGVIRSDLSGGDGVHLNNAGHGIIFNELLSDLQANFIPNDMLSKFQIYQSDLPDNSFTLLEDNIPNSTINRVITPKNNKYYKVRIYFADAVTIKETNVASLPVVTTTTTTTPSPSGQRVLFDFGGDGTGGNGALTTNPDAFGKYWNNITAMNSVGDLLPNVIDINNNNSGLMLELITRLDGTYNPSGNGMNYQGAVQTVGDYPPSAVRDNAFAYSNPSTGGSMKVKGMLANRTYSVKFWGTRDAVDSRFIQIRRAGDTDYQEYNASGNLDAQVACVFANITGVTEVTFEIKVKTGSTFGYISVLDINSVSNDLTTTTTTTTTLPALQQRILTDFGGNGVGGNGAITNSPDANGLTWNNITTTDIGTKLGNMLNTDGNTSNLSLIFLGTIGGGYGAAGNQMNFGGQNAIIGDYPASACIDNIYAYTDQFPTGQQWKITGMKANYTYRFKFWGTRAASDARIIEIKRSTDSIYKSYNAANNTNFNTSAVFDTITGITEIIFDIRAASGSQFGHISVLDIDATSNAITTTTTTTTPPPPPPDTHRILLDIGGDGVTTTDGTNPGGQITGSPDPNGRYWNNLAQAISPGVTISNMVTAANGATTVDLTIPNSLSTGFSGSGTVGLNYVGLNSAVGDYPASACRDSAFVYTGVSTGLLRFTGLTSGNAYTLKIWGSRTGVSDARILEAKVSTDFGYSSYNATNNSTFTNCITLTFTGVTTVDINVQAQAGSTFGYIGIIDLTW